uniref:Elongator complex protein 1 n=1 Tax=Ditylenchus dipsaci TaxID=166011 RepID=A0A915DYQ5_9BILA
MFIFVCVSQSSCRSELINKLKNANKFCVDIFNESTFFASTSSVIVIDKHGALIKEICIEQASPSLFNEYKTEPLVMFDFLLDDLQLCLVFQSGVIATINTEDELANLVSSLPGPITSAAWSPDQQLLILASDHMLFALSREFEIISEEILRPDQAGKDQLMTVGWGSRETQFQGAAGRKNREQVDQNKVPVAIPSVSANRSALISWRADAQFFTVSTLDEFDSSSSEEEKISCPGQEGVLCMRPTGNLIATTRLLHNKRSVWFFERNGQYRSNFELVGGEGVEVKSLAWNMDASILAVCCTSNQTMTRCNSGRSPTIAGCKVVL